MRLSVVLVYMFNGYYVNVGIAFQGGTKVLVRIVMCHTTCVNFSETQNPDFVYCKH